MTNDTAIVPDAAPPPKSVEDIPGWFFWQDRAMFTALLTAQRDEPVGHLVELGTYLGRSAVVVGAYRRPGERFLVVDLFEGTDVLGESEVEKANLRESLHSYTSLTRTAFERNYSAVRGDLPEVVAGMSSEVVRHLEPGSVRFMHIDASHLYDAVSGDVASAKLLLRPGGVVVFDDFRSEHTPGVGAAVWGACATHGLIPVALTTQKLYAVFSEPEAARRVVTDLAHDDERLWHGVQDIAGYPVIRLDSSAANKRRQREQQEAAAAASRRAVDAQIAQQVADQLAAARREAIEDYRAAQARRSCEEAARLAARAPKTRAGKLRRLIAREVAPPALTRWLVGRRAVSRGRALRSSISR